MRRGKYSLIHILKCEKKFYNIDTNFAEKVKKSLLFFRALRQSVNNRLAWFFLFGVKIGKG